MELDELHILDLPLGTIDHGYTVAGSYLRVGRRGIDGPRSSGSHQRDAAQVSIDLLRLRIENVCSVALDIGCPARHTDAQMVLRNDLHGKMILQHLDIGVVAYRFHQSALDLETGIIRMVKNAELRMSSLAVEIEGSVLFLVEINAPVDEFLNASGGIAYHLLHCRRVAQPVAGYHRVMDMFVEIIHQQVGDGGDASLRLGCIRFVQRRFATQGNTVFLGACHLESKTHACHAAADN